MYFVIRCKAIVLVSIAPCDVDSRGSIFSTCSVERCGGLYLAQYCTQFGPNKLTKHVAQGCGLQIFHKGVAWLTGYCDWRLQNASPKDQNHYLAKNMNQRTQAIPKTCAKRVLKKRVETCAETCADKSRGLRRNLRRTFQGSAPKLAPFLGSAKPPQVEYRKSQVVQ